MKIYQVDAFTDTKFKGNPAAIAITPRPIDTSLMKAIASEMNLSETAFIEPVDGNTFNLRWFTPTHEVTLCGHATLASAHLLFEKEYADANERIEFMTLSGPLLVSKKGDIISMDFPRIRTQKVEIPHILQEAYPGVFLEAWGSELDLILRVKSSKIVADFKPNYHVLSEPEYRGIIITSEGDEDGIDFVSRFFGPRVGVPEDPATGSANVLLADFWHRKTAKLKFSSRQLSKRGGEMTLELNDERVIIEGKAITVLKAELYI
ncbi:PhzF family phenazine biosynthesis protein [Fulvivirgaceae bacterium LMO-SS25]